MVHSLSLEKIPGLFQIAPPWSIAIRRLSRASQAGTSAGKGASRPFEVRTRIPPPAGATCKLLLRRLAVKRK